jgi:hypothetical protein
MTEVREVAGAIVGKTKLMALLTERQTDGTDKDVLVEIKSGRYADLQDQINRPEVIQIRSIYRGRKLDFSEKKRVSFR